MTNPKTDAELLETDYKILKQNLDACDWIALDRLYDAATRSPVSDDVVEALAMLEVYASNAPQDDALDIALKRARQALSALKKGG